MTEFLRTVAQHYFAPLTRQDNGKRDYLGLTDWMFVFPSRRAGLFFRQYLCDLNEGEPLLAPQCLTIGDLFDLFSDNRVADRTELLFRLHHIYNEVRQQHQPGTTPERFEDFIFWGEMMLRDFDEIDKYLVDASQLFVNIRDLKEIDEVFHDLDEEVIQMLRTFWHDVDLANTRPGSAKESFTKTWAILYEVYSRLKAELRRLGIAYEGMRQRDVVESLPLVERETRLAQLPKHIVLVGITAINGAERELLLWLKKAGILECCWDYGDAMVQDIPFVQANLTDFGCALSPEEQQAGIVPIEKKRLVRMAVPSGVGQTSEAAKVLDQWNKEDAIHTAVVLPDEHLLDSMLYNLPQEYPTFNVTMGYSLKSTPVATFVEALIVLQSQVRIDRNHKESFFYRAVLPILSHAFMSELLMKECTDLRKEISQRSMYQVPKEMLQNNELMRLIFRTERPIGYLRSILEYLLKAFKPKEERTDDPDELMQSETTDAHILNRECIISYLQVLSQLERVLVDTQMEMLDSPTLFHLIQKLVQGEKVSYSGEPMMGLQVMGVLETRAIDFERIVILSMNEGVVPAKASQNSFIPFSLRKAFGLPTQIFKDLVYAYHFYRLISRASEVTFLYDNRSDGMQTGEQSRYLMQLTYLAKAKIIEQTPHNAISTQEEQEVMVEKTDEVMRQLEIFLAGGHRFLSASSLKQYIDCPLRFYFACVRGLSQEEEMEEEMEDRKFGDILHNTLCAFYSRLEGKQVFADNLREALEKKGFLLDLVKEQYTKIFCTAPENGYQQLVCSLIESHVRGVLQHDMEQTPFLYLKGECTCTLRYHVSEGLDVNLKAVYDRLDIVHNADGSHTLRVVDYKTGSPKSQAKVDTDNLFGEGNKCSKEAFQVLFYCLMLKHLQQNDREKLGLLPLSADNVYQKLQPNLFFTRALVSENDKRETEVIADFSPCQESVATQINQLLAQIFDPKIPFRQTDNEDNCKNCRFTRICNKQI